MSCPLAPHCAEAEFEAIRRLLTTLTPVQRAVYIRALRQFREAMQRDYARPARD